MEAYSRLSRIALHISPNPSASLQGSSCSSDLGHIPKAAPDAIFVTNTLFKNDKDERKVNLGVGAYRTNEGKPLVLNVVKKAERLIVEDTKLDHEYLPIGGDGQFCEAARLLLFGTNFTPLKEGRVATVQSISGTGALRLACAFIKNWLPGRLVLISNPSWGNHHQIFDHTGLKYQNYRYWKESTRSLDLEGLVEDFKKAPEGSVILLHACAHNPTGVDPTEAQWKTIAQVIREKKHFPFFDSAYQGFASGDLDRDAWAIRYFGELGFEMLVCQSFAKNFGIYNERAGTLSVVAKDKKTAEAVYTQLEGIIRPMYSNPPAQGARVIKAILSDKQLYAEWTKELAGMADRIAQMRKALYDELKKLGTPGTWEHIITQIGMFSYTGLTKKQCEVLREEYHIYLLLNGRVSMAGVTPKNVGYVAKSIDEVVRKYK